MEGFITLYQPQELIDTNRFKITTYKGKDVSKLVKQLAKSRFLSIMEVADIRIAETTVLPILNSNFKQMVSADFYEASDKVIYTVFCTAVMELSNGKLAPVLSEIDEFYNYFMTLEESKQDIIRGKELYAMYEKFCLDKQYKKSSVLKFNDVMKERITLDRDGKGYYYKLKLNAVPVKKSSKTKVVSDEIEAIFPNYKQDEVFYGPKKYAKFQISSLLDMSVTCIYLAKQDKEFVLKTYTFDVSSDSLISYAVSNSIIKHDQVYDLNDPTFIELLSNRKIHKQAIDYSNIISAEMEKYQTEPVSFTVKVERLFNTNIVINGVIHVNDTHAVLYDEGPSTINFIEINNILIHFDDLRKYMPVIIQENDTEYYMINEEKQYINSVETLKYKSNFIYMNIVPNVSTLLNKEQILQFEEQVKNKTCLNSNTTTTMYFNLLKRILV
jgi:hypothetical protein